MLTIMGYLEHWYALSKAQKNLMLNPDDFIALSLLFDSYKARLAEDENETLPENKKMAKEICQKDKRFIKRTGDIDVSVDVDITESSLESPQLIVDMFKKHVPQSREAMLSLKEDRKLAVKLLSNPQFKGICVNSGDVNAGFSFRIHSDNQQNKGANIFQSRQDTHTQTINIPNNPQLQPKNPTIESTLPINKLYEGVEEQSNFTKVQSSRSHQYQSQASTDFIHQDYVIEIPLQAIYDEKKRVFTFLKKLVQLHDESKVSTMLADGFRNKIFSVRHQDKLLDKNQQLPQIDFSHGWKIKFVGSDNSKNLECLIQSYEDLAKKINLQMGNFEGNNIFFFLKKVDYSLKIVFHFVSLICRRC